MACTFSRIGEFKPYLVAVQYGIGKNAERTGDDGEIVEIFTVAPNFETDDICSAAPEIRSMFATKRQN